MAYNPNIPQPTDLLSNSQGQVLGNFTSLGNAWPVNHGPFDGATAGMHLFVQLPVTYVAGTVPPMAANQIGMTTLSSPYTGQPEMQIIRPNGNTTVEFTSAGAFANGWTRLPSGILLKWGSFTLTAATTTLVYPVNVVTIPPFLAAYQTIITPLSTNAYNFFNTPFVIAGATYTAVQFQVGYQGITSANSQCSYLTIGI